MTQDDQFGQPPDSTPSAMQLPLVIGLALAVALLGGVACGWAISYFGELGSISLWLLGVLAGLAGKKIIAGPSRLTAWLLVVACVVAFAIAEICWIHWATKQGAEGWWKSVTLLLTFVQQYRIAALAGTIFTVFGALSAYRHTARQ
jgi:hypothetical protein